MKHDTKPPLWRRLVRSTVIACTLLIVVVALVLARWTSAARAQATALAAIQAQTLGWFAYDYQCPAGTPTPEATSWAPDMVREALGDDLLHPVVYGQVAPAKATEAHLQLLQSLPQLRYLEIGAHDEEGCLNDAGLVPLGQLRQLESLNIANARISNAGLAHLSDLTRLTTLNLTNARIDNSGLRPVAGFTRLRSLNLEATRIDDQGLTHLAGLTQLETLNLDYTRVAGPGFDQLKGLTRLRTLSLNATYLDDAGLGKLVRFVDLEELALEDNPDLTDTGLASLKSLPKLVRLKLRGTRVTAAGVAALQALRPQLVIDTQ